MRNIQNIVLTAALALSACAAQEQEAQQTAQEAPLTLRAVASAYPEVVRLEVVRSDGQQVRCTATLLSSRAVLTSNTCVENATVMKAIAVNGGGQVAYSRRAVVYEADKNLKVAVVLLKTPIVLSSYASVSGGELRDSASAVLVGIGDSANNPSDQIWEADPVTIRTVTVSENDRISIDYRYSAASNKFFFGGGPAFVPGTHRIMGVASLGRIQYRGGTLSLPVIFERVAPVAAAQGDIENLVNSNTSADVETADCLFNYAERAFPSVFPAPRPATQSAGEYVYRYYEATKTYLGLSNNGKLYTLSEGGQPVEQGIAADRLEEAGCR